MKKMFMFVSVLVMACLLYVGPAFAAYETQIDSYDMFIKVNEDNSYEIVEKIGAYFNTDKHGIYRTIPLQNNIIRADGTMASIQAEITDIDASEKFSLSTANKNGVLYRQVTIGDASTTTKGAKNYVLSYTYNLGKDTADGYDEFYFNIIGSDWVDSMINNITFTIELPKKFDATKVNFIGLEEDEKDIEYAIVGNVITGKYLGTLFEGEALTVRIQLPDGYFVDNTNKTKWLVNNPSIAIYDPGVQDDGVYHVNYNDTEAELVPESDSIHLLMINGGFVSDPQIIVEDGRTLVPIRIISEILGAKVDWADTTKTVTITEGDNIVSLQINNSVAKINGVNKILDVPAKIINSKTYVPLRFIVEALDAEVQYVPSFANAEDNTPHLQPKAKVNAVVIEKVLPNVAVSTPTQGLAIIRKASAETYSELLAYYAEIDATFGDGYNKDYDSQLISYTNENIGRYYIYKLKGFESYKILFNKYTEEIYCEKAGLPFLNISKGFINIPWIYQ